MCESSETSILLKVRKIRSEDDLIEQALPFIDTVLVPPVRTKVAIAKGEMLDGRAKKHADGDRF